MRPSDSLTKRFDVLGFLLFSHGWTWLCWGLVVVMRWDAFEFPGILFLVLGGIGPMLGGIIMSGVVGGRAELRDLGNRLVDPRRVPLRWWLVILGFFPIVTAVAALLAVGLDLTAEPVDLSEPLELFSNPGTLLVTAAFILILGPLPEEIGWRGFLLDRLQLRWSALTASLLVGGAWLVWHAPLFVMAGYYDALGGPPNLGLFTTGIVIASLFYTWIHNNTDRSVLAAILFHFSQNFTGQVFSPTVETRVVQAALFITLAVVVLLFWGPQRLRRRGTRPRPVTGFTRSEKP